MLIVEQEDISKLEEYGFRPKYDEDTGNLVSYFHVSADNFGLFTRLDLQLNGISTKPKKLKIRFTFKRGVDGIPKVKEDRVWLVSSESFDNVDFDLLYDLIKAGIIKKIK